jgi:Do/DeqQ family serine protease
MNKNKDLLSKGEFDQRGYYPVGLTVAAENTDFTLAAERSVHAVVHIKSIVNPSQRENNRNYFDPFEFFFGGQSQGQHKIGFGSGVIISNDGYIVTNHHVIDRADEIEVTTNDEKLYKAKLVGSDEATDVALLKIDGKDFPIIPFGDSDALKIGEWVLAVGNPFNLTSTVTAGIVSAKGRGSLFSGYGDNGRRGLGQTPQMRMQADKIESFIQTDAAVNPGNSGGALVNTKGELVGINTAIYSETGNFVGYSFAIPISIVKKVASDIKQYGIVQRALLGVLITDLPVLKEQDLEKYNKLKVKEGVYINGFSSKSSAEKAGIKIGDVIIGIDNQKIRNFQELKAQISRYNPGDKIDVLVQRDNDQKTYKVELKNDMGTTEAIKHQSVSDIMGASFKELPKQTQLKLGINYGVEVTNLTTGKLKDVGIRNGFIILTANEYRISSSESLIKIIESLLKQDPDDRGLYIKGFYPDTKRVEYYAFDLSN